MDKKLEMLYKNFLERLTEFGLKLQVTEDAIYITDVVTKKTLDLSDLIEKFEDMFLDDEEDADKVLDLGSFEGRAEMFMEEIEMSCYEEKVKLDKFWDYIYSVN